MISRQAAQMGIDLAKQANMNSKAINYYGDSVLGILLSSSMLDGNQHLAMGRTYEEFVDMIVSSTSDEEQVMMGDEFTKESQHSIVMEHSMIIARAVEERIGLVVNMVIPEIKELHAKLVEAYDSQSSTPTNRRSYDFFDASKQLADISGDTGLIYAMEHKTEVPHTGTHFWLDYDFLMFSSQKLKIKPFPELFDYIVQFSKGKTHHELTQFYYNAELPIQAFKVLSAIKDKSFIPEDNPHGITIEMIRTATEDLIYRLLVTIEEIYAALTSETAEGKVFTGMFNKDLVRITIVASDLGYINKPIIGVYKDNAMGLDEDVLEAIIGGILYRTDSPHNTTKLTKSSLELEETISGYLNDFKLALSAYNIKDSSEVGLTVIEPVFKQVVDEFAAKKGFKNTDWYYDLAYETKHFSTVSDAIFDYACSFMCSVVYKPYGLGNIIRNLIGKQKEMVGSSPEDILNEVVLDSITNIIKETLYIGD